MVGVDVCVGGVHLIFFLGYVGCVMKSARFWKRSVGWLLCGV